MWRFPIFKLSFITFFITGYGWAILGLKSLEFISLFTGVVSILAAIFEKDNDQIIR